MINVISKQCIFVVKGQGCCSFLCVPFLWLLMFHVHLDYFHYIWHKRFLVLRMNWEGLDCGFCTTLKNEKCAVKNVIFLKKIFKDPPNEFLLHNKSHIGLDSRQTWLQTATGLVFGGVQLQSGDSSLCHLWARCPRNLPAFPGRASSWVLL